MLDVLQPRSFIQQPWAKLEISRLTVWRGQKQHTITMLHLTLDGIPQYERKMDEAGVISLL